MLNLKTTERGKIGDAGNFFSDVYAAALKGKFSGQIRLILQSGEAITYWKGGAPVHVTGSAVSHDKLGELLLESGATMEAAIEGALHAQSMSAALLGEILVNGGDASAKSVSDAMVKQNIRRLKTLFNASAGEWFADSGEVEQIKKIATPIDGWAKLLYLLKAGASDAEFRELGDRFLASAAKLNTTITTLDPLHPDELELRTLDYLNKPRKLHQLELAVNDRRAVRAVIKAVSALGYLELPPIKQALPIEEAKRLRPGMFNRAQPEQPPEEQTQVQQVEVEQLQTAPKTSVAPKAPLTPEAQKLADEVKQFYSKMDDWSHFDILGVTRDTPDAEIRMRFAMLAKKFHPDAFGTDVAEDLAAKTRAVAAALNEAYSTLIDQERRASYITALDAGDLKGDSTKKQQQVSAAKTKYEMAVILMKKQDYQKARELLHFAVEMAPQVGVFKAAYGWAYFIDSKIDKDERFEKAFKYISEAMMLTKNDANICYYYGRILKERGEIDKAAKAFHQAVKLSDGKHADAVREVRLTERRKEEKGEKKGLLKGLFKRGDDKG